METKIQVNKRTGERREVVKLRDKWVPIKEAELMPEYHRAKIAEETGGFEAFSVGVGKRVDDLAEGIDNLFGLDKYASPDDTGYAELKDAHPFATGAGEAVSEIAQMAIPAGGAMKAMKGAKWAKNSPLLAATLADIAGASGMAYLREPGEDTSRAEAAGSEALWSAAGGALGKMLKGVTLSKAGREAVDRGDYLTPGYATDNHILSGVENAMEVTPGLANATKVARGKAQQDWRNHVFNSVGKKLGIKVSGDTGIESYTKIADHVQNGYKTAMEEVTDIPRSTFEKVYKIVGKKSGNLSRADQAHLQEVAKRVRTFEEKMGKKNANAAAIADQMDYYLRTQASSYEGPLREAILAVKKGFHKNLDPAVAKKLETLDDVFPDVLTLQDAVTSANKEFMQGGFSPKQLMAGSYSTGPKDAFARGKSSLFDIAQAGGETVGQHEGGAPLEWFRRLAGVAPSPPGMETMGNTIIGNTAAHRSVKELPEALLRSVAPSKVLPASSDDEEDNLVKLLRSLVYPSK